MVSLVVGAGVHTFDGVADLSLDSVWGRLRSTELLGGATTQLLEVATFDIGYAPCVDLLVPRTHTEYQAQRLLAIGDCVARVFGASPFVRLNNNLLVPVGTRPPQVVAFGDLCAVPVDAVLGPLAGDLVAADFELTGATRAGELTWLHFADVDHLSRLIEMVVPFGATTRRWEMTVELAAGRRLAASAGIVDSEYPDVCRAVHAYVEPLMSGDWTPSLLVDSDPQRPPVE